MLAACATSGSQLPQAPVYAAPVVVAEPKAGEDPLAVAARERAGRIQANERITDFKDWYDGVRSNIVGAP